MSDKNFKVKSGLQVPSLTTAGPVVTDSSGNVTSSATLPISQGGTGQTTAGNALNAILPLQTSNDNKYLQTNGVDTQWNTVLQPVYADNAPSSPQVGQVWIESDSSSDSFDPNIIRRKTFTATAAQTVFTTDLEFIQGYEQVFFNGMLLIRNSDYTTASNTNVTLAAGAAAGDIIEVVSITNLNSINAVATTGANTITANTASVTPLTIQGAVSQSAALLSLSANTGTMPIVPTGTALRTIGADATTSIILMDGAGGGSAGQFIGRRSQGTIASPTATTSGVYLAVFGGRGYGTTGYIPSDSANLRFESAEAFTDTASGAYITLNTTPTGTVGTPIERMRVDASGKVGIGTTAPAAKLHIDNTGGGQSPLRVKPPTGGYNALELVSGYTGNMSWGLNDAGGSGAMYFYQYDSAGSYARTPLTIESSGTFTLSYVDASAPILYNTSNNNNKLMVFEGYASNKWNLWGGHGGGSYFGISENASSTPVFAITGSTNHVLVGYTSSQGSYKLQVNSQIFATSSSIATSDGRFKDNVDTISGGLGIIDSLRPVSFTWKDHPVHNFVAGKTVGFIAQEVKEALSEYDWVDNIIKTNTSDAILDEEGNEVTPSEEFLGIAESNIIPLLVAAVKELKARVETLEANNV